MDTHLLSIFGVLNNYQQSISKNLLKIRELLLHGITNPNTQTTLSKRHIMSLEMCSIMQKYVDILYSSEQIIESVSSKIAELDRTSEPERDCRSLNPFIITDVEDQGIMALIEPHARSEEESDLSEIESLSDHFQVFEFTANANQTEVEARKTDSISVNGSSDDTKIVAKECVKLEENESSDQVEQKKVMKSAFKLAETVAPRVSFQIDESPKLNRRGMSEEDDSSSRLKGTIKKRDSRAKERNHCLEIENDVLTADQSCVVTCVESPSEFYVHRDSNLAQRFEDSLNEDMNKKHYNVVNNYKTKIQAKDVLGNICLAFLPFKQKWYRVEVIDWMLEEPQSVFVQLLDYGRRLQCDFRNLKPMAEDYAKFQKMAIRCHMACIYSPNVESRRKWPAPSTEYFVKLTQGNPQQKFNLIYVNLEGNSYSVDLLKSDGGNRVTVGEMLVAKGYACEMEITRDNYLNSITEEDIVFDNLNELISGYDAKDEARLCPHTDRSGRCFKGPSCRLEHGKLAKDGTTLDKELTAKEAFKGIDLPAVGKEFEVLVTGYIDTCHFYVQVMGKKRTGLYNDSFQRLRETMKTNNVVQTYERFKIHPGLGEIILVKDETDWLRARCVGYLDGDQIEVFLVDYGYKVSKNLKDCRLMKEDFLHIPFQAVECSLRDYQERKFVSKLQSKAMFDKIFNMQIFKAVITDLNHPIQLQLRDKSNNDMGYVLSRYDMVEQRKHDYPQSDSIVRCG